MKTIELNSRTDKNGNLVLNYPLYKKNKDVRILILLDENSPETDEEKLWLNSISKNPSFHFLNEPEEDIYSLNDGEPINEK